MDKDKKIISCEIKQLAWRENQVWATFEDGVIKNLFSYDRAELFFSPDEFAGLTEEEAYYLMMKKDIAYLRS